MTTSRGINTVNFITKVQVQTVQDQSNQLLSTARDIRRHWGNNRVGRQWDHFTWLFVFILNFVFPFNDFLLLGSPSLCTKTPIHGQNINTSTLWSENFFCLCFECKFVQWLNLNEPMHMNIIKTIWHVCPAKQQRQQQSISAQQQ